jgi:hypothetical protein
MPISTEELEKRIADLRAAMLLELEELEEELEARRQLQTAN